MDPHNTMLIRPHCRQLTSLWLICEDRFSAEHQEEDCGVQRQTEEQRKLGNGLLLWSFTAPAAVDHAVRSKSCCSCRPPKTETQKNKSTQLYHPASWRPTGMEHITWSLLLSLEGVFSAGERLHAEALTY